MAEPERLDELERALRKDPQNAALQARLEAARERSDAPDPRSTWPVLASRRVHIWAGFKKDGYPTACGKDLKRGAASPAGDPEAVDCWACLDSPIGRFLSGQGIFPKDQNKIPEHLYDRYGKTTARALRSGGFKRTAKGLKRKKNLSVDLIHREPPPEEAED